MSAHGMDGQITDESSVDDVHYEHDSEGEEEAELGDDNGTDEPEAELDAPPPPRPEPSYAMANEMSFSKLCQKLERIWNLRTKNEEGTADEKLIYLLPPKQLEKLRQRYPPESMYPIFRLLCRFVPKTVDESYRLCFRMYGSHVPCSFLLPLF